MCETALAIVGGGPAGCAAAVMAASLDMPSVLIEPEALCHTLDRVGAAVNVLGGFSSGRELAARIADDVARAAHCGLRLGRCATAIRAADDHVTVEVDDGRSLRAAYAVVATGVRPQTIGEADWISQDREVSAEPLWNAAVSELERTESLVIGVDRPLGALLRTYPDLDLRLLVLYSADDAYKADGIRADPRVVLLPTARLELTHDRIGALRAHALGTDRETRTFTHARAYLNLGSRPVLPPGDLRRDASGYCPPAAQHPRILVAGDLRGARYQRIMTAFGAGAEAALTAYYACSRAD